MGKLARGLFVLSAAVALGSSTSRVHACCGLDAEAEACREAAIRAELAELAPLKLAFSFSHAVSEAAAIDGEECSCDERCRCGTMTHRLHEDVVLAELDASTKAVMADGAKKLTDSPPHFVRLAFAFSRGETDRLLGDRMERELAVGEERLVDVFGTTRFAFPGLSVAFSFADDSWHFFWNADAVSAGDAGYYFWPSTARTPPQGVRLERFLKDLKKRESEIAADFAAAHSVAGLDNAESLDAAPTDQSARRCLVERTLLHEDVAIAEDRTLEESLAEHRPVDDCVLCEASIDAPLPMPGKSGQFQELPWQAPRSWPVDRVTPRIPDPVRMFDAPEHTVMGEVVAIEGVAMRFADEDHFTFGGVRFSR